MSIACRSQARPLLAATCRRFSGGKGANQSYAAGRMGARVSMIGQVGSDGLASLLLQSLQSAGVHTDSVGKVDLSTGAAVILVLPDGENLIVISPGANATVTPGLAAQRLSALSEGSYLLSQLEIPIESVDESLAVAKARGATTILDPAPARELSPDLLRKVDFLTPNETETETLLGAPGLKMESDADLELAARAVLALGPRSVVLKLGARGCVIAGGRGMPARSPGSRCLPLTQPRPETYSTAPSPRHWPKAGAFSKLQDSQNAAAALSVTRPGAQNSVPSRQEARSAS